MVSSSLWSYARNGGLTDRVDGEPSPREDPDGRHLLGHVRVELVRSFVPFQGVQTAPFQIVVALEQGIRTDPHVFRHRHAADPQRPRATCQFKQLVNSFSNCELISISPDGSIDCPLAHTHTHTHTPVPPFWLTETINFDDINDRLKSDAMNRSSGALSSIRRNAENPEIKTKNKRKQRAT